MPELGQKSSVTTTVVPVDESHIIQINLSVSDEGDVDFNVGMSLAMRDPSGKIVERINGVKSLNALAAVSGSGVTAADVQVISDVLYKIGKMIVIDNGCTIVSGSA